MQLPAPLLFEIQLSCFAIIATLASVPVDEPSLTKYLRALACAIIGMIGASFSSLDKRVKGRDMYWHIFLAFFVCGVFFLSAYAMFPNYDWLVWALPCFFIGLCIYGIAVQYRKLDREAGEVDLTKIIRKKTGIEE